MRSCPLFEHLLSPSLNNDIFQITNQQQNCMEEKYFQVRENIDHNRIFYKNFILGI